MQFRPLVVDRLEELMKTHLCQCQRESLGGQKMIGRRPVDARAGPRFHHRGRLSQLGLASADGSQGSFELRQQIVGANQSMAPPGNRTMYPIGDTASFIHRPSFQERRQRGLQDLEQFGRHPKVFGQS
ncbi:hypothetical protein FHP25_32670 [Vineibacter terrae]|uniref:Uncharacterized protein n=1 Tax=Vineibacter terrae TaxID=2586908 RepID=A0A5C8PBQ4_9HYPH|nr:hypothetical protein [Vineibacter terrae]TXL70875.1 hypothetical protein FHP25_32670 [Vineibacter terrae]